MRALIQCLGDDSGDTQLIVKAINKAGETSAYSLLVGDCVQVTVIPNRGIILESATVEPLQSDAVILSDGLNVGDGA